MMEISKEEIIKSAEQLGFHLDYDKWNNPDKSEYSTGDWMRFCLPDDLDEKDLRWIWYKTDSYSNNMNRGLHIQARGKKKAEIQNFLKY